MLVGGKRFARHRIAFLLGAMLLISLPAIVWYVGARFEWLPWPRGSEPVGLFCGLIAAGIVYFEMMLWVRKRLRGRRLGATRIWMFLHVWLGLISLPLALCHSGFSLGGSLSAAVLILFLIVIASGVWGLALQQILPLKMLHDLPGESIVDRMDDMMASHLSEARILVSRLTQSGSDRIDPVLSSEVTIQDKNRALSVGPLLDFFEQTIVPYLLRGKQGNQLLSSRNQSQQIFAEFRRSFSESSSVSVIDRLEELCEWRRQLDTQARYLFWLHNWLLVHLPLSIALMVLLSAHLVIALKLW